MWIAASIPFWVSGFVFTFGGLIAPFNRRLGETDRDLLDQFIFGTTLGGILFVIAAKIAS